MGVGGSNDGRTKTERKVEELETVVFVRIRLVRHRGARKGVHLLPYRQNGARRFGSCRSAVDRR